MVFLKLEKLSVLESGILFIAAEIIMIIILYILLFLMIFRTSRGLHELALARQISALWTCPLAPGPWLYCLHSVLRHPTLLSSTGALLLLFPNGLHLPMSVRLSSEVTSLRCLSLTIFSKGARPPHLALPCLL